MTLREFIKKYKDFEFQDEAVEWTIGKAIYDGDIDFEPISQSYIRGIDRKMKELKEDIMTYDRLLHYRRNNLPVISYYEDEEKELVEKYGKIS